MEAARSHSKAECLKRYLPAPVDAESKATSTRYKKLRKVTGAGSKGMRIVDDDVSWADMSTKSEKEEKEDEGDLPVVAEFIDERPEVKQMEAFRAGNKGKLLGEQKSDLSPPRRTRHNSSDSSPPRRTRHDSSDSSPPRRRTRHDSPDSSPPRRTQQDSSDPLQPRRFPFNIPDLAPEVCHSLSGKAPTKSSLGLKKSSTHGDESSQHKNRSPSSPGPGIPLPDSRHSSPSHRKFRWKPPTKKLKRYHVDSSQDQEIKHLEVEFQNAETIFRDKSGRKRDPKLDRLEKRGKEKSKKNEQYAQWGKGLAQSQQQQQNMEDAIKEMQKPFSRYINDEDLDQMLREQEREGDPMANFIKKNKVKRNKDKKEKPRYNGPAPPLNRFNIWPGYRWDGVDRSNGFEEKHFIRLANKKAVEELAYKWSTEDM